MRLLILSFFIICFSLPVLAQDAATPEPTRIEIDSKAGEIHFFIDGKLEAVLKSDGLHIRESIGYGGTLIDYGTPHFDKITEKPNEEKEEKGAADAP